MPSLAFQSKTYEVDDWGFLVRTQDWDEGFARGMASELGITGGLTYEHWGVIAYIRSRHAKTGECPTVYEAARHCHFKLHELKRLFPTGYLRGACKLAGLTFMEEQVHSSWLPAASLKRATTPPAERVYRVNWKGFLIDPAEWDDEYAASMAREFGYTQLGEKHWRVIAFLRDHYARTGKIATVYETCEANNLDLEDLEELFPSGYHRGAVKIAGLRER